MIRLIKIMVLLSLTSIAPCQSPNYSINISAERDTALIGEQFHFTIEIASSIPLTSFFPIDDQLFPPAIEVISVSTDSSKSGQSRLYSSNYIITSFDSGVYETNPIPVLINASSRLDTIYTGTRILTIISPEVDTTAQIMDLKEPLNTPFILKELLPYAPYAGGLLVLVGIALFWFYFIRKQKTALLDSVPSLPPHIKALEALDRIKNHKLWQKGEVKEYYSQLSDTIRIYMEERFDIPAMESVTSDILLDFKKFSWEDETLLEILESLLQLSDLVKFAKEDPLPSDNEMNLNNAYIFVEKTKPVARIEPSSGTTN